MKHKKPIKEMILTIIYYLFEYFKIIIRKKKSLIFLPLNNNYDLTLTKCFI